LLRAVLGIVFVIFASGGHIIGAFGTLVLILGILLILRTATG
jgi:hypothetical protein